MKMKRLALIYTLMIVLVATIGFIYFSKSNSSSFDVTSVYKASSDAMNELYKGQAKENVETKYNLKIIYDSEPDYEAKVWEAIKNRDVLVDLEGNGIVPNGKIIIEVESAAYKKETQILWGAVIGIALLLAFMGYGLIIYVNKVVIKPFATMKDFASEVANGNLDMKLPMFKANYFGAFTESFDLMREELKNAREQEYLANQSKKELVAELSHDIKTPLATIKANCELLILKTQDENLKKHILIVEDKANTINQLVDNLFHATLEELKVLKVTPIEENSLEILKMIEGLSSYGNVELKSELHGYLVWMDKLRFNQVIDNIVYNSYKYAGTKVTVSFADKENGLLVKISDNGPGVKEDELPLVCEKFFRGSNSAGKQGSGLGLFLSKSFMKDMGGELNCYNDNGFVVELFLKRV